MIKTNKTITRTISFTAIMLLLFLYYYKNDLFSDGFRKGLSLCITVIIPSLFPMMILTGLIIRTGLPARIKSIIVYPFRLLLRFPPEAAEIYLLGAVGGFPVGVKTAEALYLNHTIALKDAQNTALCNVCPGLAFSVIVIGRHYCASAATGFSLLLCVWASNLILNLIIAREKENRERCVHIKPDAVVLSPAQALTETVDEAVKSTVSICAWIVAFCTFTAPVNAVSDRFGLLGLLEVSAGAVGFAEAGNLSGACFCMAFGGVCLYFQLLPALSRLKISAVKYFSCRIFSGLTACLMQRLISFFHPFAVPAFSPTVFKVQNASGSVFGLAALFFLSYIFMLSVLKKPVK